jgi:hypothetical protein
MRINLRLLIQTLSLDRKELARALFPGHKRPELALSRVVAKKSELRETQMLRLAIFSGLSIDALYESSAQWKMKVESDLIRFTRGEFVAVYSPKTGITKIYSLETVIATHFLSKPTQPLSEYLEEITRIVINKSIKQ